VAKLPGGQRMYGQGHLRLFHVAYYVKLSLRVWRRGMYCACFARGPVKVDRGRFVAHGDAKMAGLLRSARVSVSL
jgi:hypothetical protein